MAGPRCEARAGRTAGESEVRTRGFLLVPPYVAKSTSVPMPAAFALRYTATAAATS